MARRRYVACGNADTLDGIERPLGFFKFCLSPSRFSEGRPYLSGRDQYRVFEAPLALKRLVSHRADEQFGRQHTIKERLVIPLPVLRFDLQEVRRAVAGALLLVLDHLADVSAIEMLADFEQPLFPRG